MGIIVKEVGQNIEPIPEGVHHAIAYAVFDLGTHFSEKFNKRSRQLVIIWELPEERIIIEKDGVKKNLPRATSKKYTATLSEKSNLRKDLQSWRGKVFTPEELQGFDITKLLGANCMLQIIHSSKDGKTYANISAILPLYKGVAKKPTENPMVFFSLDEEQPIPETTPDWIKDIIMDSDEWQSKSPAPADTEDDIPF